MLRKYQTQAGLNYAMDEDLYDSLDENDMYIAERYIEASEYCNSLFSFLSFIIVSFITNNIIILGLATFVGHVIGSFFSLSFKFLHITFIRNSLTLYGVLQKFFIIILFVFVFSIFYLHNWVIAIVNLGISFLFGLIYTFLLNYEKKAKLHNQIAKYLSTKTIVSNYRKNQH